MKTSRFKTPQPATFRGDYVTVALLILLANVFDGIDGYAARLTRTTSQFGVEFYCLADVVSFGVVPAVPGDLRIGGADG